MTSPNNQLVIDKIKSGELLTPEYQEACRQRKAAVMLERSKRAKQDNDFYTKLWEENKAKRESYEPSFDVYAGKESGEFVGD